MFDGYPLFGAPRPPLFANARNNPPTGPVPGTFAPGLFSAGTAAARYQAATAEARAARARNRADLGLNPGAWIGVRPMFEPSYRFTFDDFVEADNYAVNGYVKSSMGL